MRLPDPIGYAPARCIIGLLLCASTAFGASPPAPAPTPTGWGPHLGLTINPDQFTFGFHLLVGADGPGFVWRPGFDIGVGDGATVASVNVDIVRRLPAPPNGWIPFLGGGAGIAFNEFDTPRFDSGEPDGLGDNFETGLGLNLVGGFERDLVGETVFIETRFGWLDLPELKITAGWTLF